MLLESIYVLMKTKLEGSESVIVFVFLVLLCIGILGSFFRVRVRHDKRMAVVRASGKKFKDMNIPFKIFIKIFSIANTAICLVIMFDMSFEYGRRNVPVGMIMVFLVFLMPLLFCICLTHILDTIATYQLSKRQQRKKQ
ncbi:MAG: hypothetical protein VX730_01630 [Pseudomonadota bacterium]|nr:hypothetical protein [Pseudomonadota bacterium]